MRVSRHMALMLICLLLSACGVPQLFPKNVMVGVDKNFDFIDWKNAPNAKVDRKVQIGGRVIETNSTEGETLIVAQQLPIAQHPAYGPKDTGKRTGEFAIAYAGKLPASALAKGYKLIVVGTTQKTRVVDLEDGKRSLPAILAACIHVWKTGMHDDIADFSSVGAGYETLEENTHCISSQ